MDEEKAKFEELDPETGEVVFTMEDAGNDSEDDVSFEDTLRYDEGRIAEIMMKFELENSNSCDYPRWRSGVPSLVLMGASLIWLAIAMITTKRAESVSWLNTFAPVFVFLISTLAWMFITFRPETIRK